MSSLLVDIDRLATYDAEGVAPYIIGKKEISNAPYTFRQGLGTMADMEIVGGTVAWNQRLNYANGTYEMNGVTIVINNGLITMTGTANASVNKDNIVSNIKLIKGHKYIFGCPLLNLPISNNYASHAQLFTSTNEAPKFQIYENSTNNHIIFSYNYEYDATYRLRIRIQEGVAYNTKEYIQLFDLTQMFGSTIADYIYSLEQATAGAGVAWFRKLFPADYYPYDAGSLKSVEGLQSRDVSGFNQWDEEWELLEGTGQNLKNKNPIPVQPDTSYNFHNGAGNGFASITWIDAEGNTISSSATGASVVDVAQTSPSSAAFVNFLMRAAYGITYNHDICINISDQAKNGTYEPYHGRSYPLDSSLTLRGIPKLDSNNKLYYDGDVYCADGSVERKYGIVDLGTLTWGVQPETVPGIFIAVGLNRAFGNGNFNMVCPKYVTYTGAHSTGTNIGSLVQANGNGIYLNSGSKTFFIADSAYTDAATFKTAMSGVMLVYELATPTTESAQPYQNPQRAFSDGTEGFTMTGIVPVGNNTTYQLSKALIPAEDYTDGAMEILEDCIETKTDILAIAPNEPGTTASQAYSAGDHFYKDGKFCTAITSISSGATFTKNTNYREESTGASSAMNNYRSKKLTATVSSTSLAFTDTLISNSATVIDGPYIADVMVGVTDATISSNTVTFTLDSSSANGKSAYIWLRY